MARALRVYFVAILAIVLSMPMAEAQEKKKSSLRGAGLGALVGQMIGGDTEATLVGAAVGVGVGYVVGNEKDKKAAEEQTRRQAEAAAAAQAADAAEEEPGKEEREQLDESRWRVSDITTKEELPEYESKIVIFRSDRSVETITTYKDKDPTVSKESFRIVGETLVINKPGYLVNIDFKLDGDELILSNEDFTALLIRIEVE